MGKRGETGEVNRYLGTVHLKMYRRILYQDAMARAVMGQGQQELGEAGLAAKLDMAAPAARKAPLEHVIDTEDILGWLAAAVEQCERRFALAVVTALDERPERMGELKATMRQMGRARSLKVALSATAAFALIRELLLDGMPADFPFVMEHSDEGKVIWRVERCPHARYWAQLGVDPDTYYRLRDAWVEGMLMGSGVVHERDRVGRHTLIVK